ncbi:MAG: phosphate ABC transporter permease PstA [Labrys sp. (in: a-proteobacteria)]
MTDIPVGRSPATSSRGIDISSPEAMARIKARYNSEWRFRAYGIAAVIIAASFIVVLLGDTIMKAIPAFTQTRVTIAVNVKADVIDPAGTRDPSTIAAADFNSLIRDSLRDAFPLAKSRSERKLLSGLVSSGAADDLRQAVLADPSLIGTSITFNALLSDDADLFLKGRMTAIREQVGRGEATPDGTEGEITIVSTVNDFAEPLLLAKQALAAEAEALTFEASRVEANAVDATGDERATLDAKVVELRARAAELMKRHDASSAPEPLGVDLPSTLVYINGGVVKASEIAGDRIKGTVLLPMRDAAPAGAGSWRIVTLERPEGARRVSDLEAIWLEDFKDRGQITRNFNWDFFTRGDSREPELAGVLGGLVGSLLTMSVTLVLCLPIGVLAAIYLEEFAPKNRLTELVEVNINNLAAVPSIVFGLLGLAVFLNFFGMPRSAPIVGGLVIALMVLPTIIIAARAAIRAVPPSIREGALGVGASHQQAVFHHVLPLAMPGIMTGTIIGMAHALGETAPLIMIGMVAFVVDIPGSFTAASSVLPVQIFSWADLPEIAFQAKTAAAIIVLLVFLFIMNGLAIILRKRFERRW